MDDRGRPLADRPRPAASSSRSSASCASWRPAADRQCRTTGSPDVAREGEVPAQVDELRVDRREDAVVVEAGLARSRRRRAPRPGARSRARSARRPLRRRGGGCRRRRRGRRSARRVPARRATSAGSSPARDPLDAGRHGPPRQPRPRRRANRSAWRWQWLSTRRTQAGFSQSAISVPSESSRTA